MKKLITGIISALSITLLVGCGSATTSSKISGDEEFVKIASKAINKRWDEQDKVTNDENSNNKNIEIVEREVKTLEELKER
ncbi:hypothetical protein [Clostridium massiliamazoniense]|uniref:hypothetical protein n=1 Tax=Clostridium massiliamazoniense TaxID=1347366 RepID=UPI0006D7C09E|nr:hypothetical protein [Clostridium massiliamazoniense]